MRDAKDKASPRMRYLFFGEVNIAMELGPLTLLCLAHWLWPRLPEGKCSLPHLWLFLHWWVGASSPFRGWKETTQALIEMVRYTRYTGRSLVGSQGNLPNCQAKHGHSHVWRPRFQTSYTMLRLYNILEIKAGDMWSLQLLGCSLRHRFEAPLETWRTAGLSMFSRVFIFQVLQGLVDLSGKFFYHLVI